MTITANFPPARVLLTCSALVAASTLLLPAVGGYGTILFQIVVLNAWDLVARVTSERYADLHHTPMWGMALLLNLLLFLVPACAYYRLCRRRWPTACAIGLACWCAFYLSALFFLFPATDGP